MITTLLGGLSAEEFLAEYWQKKPLLVRQAVPGFAGLLSKEDMFDLACDPDVESRYVRHTETSWDVRHGPQRRADLRGKKSPWTVLVQGLNLFVPEGDELMHRFHFIPQARLDDLMVSYAVDGGGVGPHFDNYDVFLLQGMGKRRWQIANQDDHTLIEGIPL
ncbi:MAG: cupin domain-containing protein, partial [Zoogloea sp.]|nr:cupin domain-containing protein [Zoogloea sp.]